MQADSIFPVILFGLLIFAGYYSWKTVRLIIRKNASQKWPVTEGKVIGKEITTTPGGRGARRYYPIITYAYDAMGEEFIQSISLEGRTYADSAEQDLKGVQDCIDIRYNPDNPSDHFLGEDRTTLRFNDMLPVLISWSLILLFLYGWLQ